MNKEDIEKILTELGGGEVPAVAHEIAGDASEQLSKTLKHLTIMFKLLIWHTIKKMSS